MQERNSLVPSNPSPPANNAPSDEAGTPQIVLSFQDNTEVIITPTQFLKQVPAGLIPRFEISAWDSDGQWCRPYRLIHYNKGSLKRMSRHALCDRWTGREMNWFYSDELGVNDPGGGQANYCLCPDCARLAADRKTPRKRSTTHP